MVRETIRNTIINIFENFYMSINSQPSYELKISKIEDNAINNFISFLSTEFNLHSVGVNFLTNFMEKEFEYLIEYSQVQNRLKYGTRGIRLSMVIGSNSIQRYKKRCIGDYSHRYYPRFLNKNKILTESVNQTSKTIENLTKINSYEEKEKKRYHNTEIGLSHCIENTTLYNHKSDNCFNCIYKSSCKDIAKTHFNNIYKNRIYGQ